MRSRSLTFAVEEAYSGLLPTGRFPIAVVDLRLPPEEVDVNVHPAKAEVRSARRPPGLRAGAETDPARPLSGLAAPAFAEAPAWPRPFQTYQPEGAAGPIFDFKPHQEGGPAPESGRQEALPARIPMLRPLGQAGTTYLIAEGPAGLYLIDQHAAHERVLVRTHQGRR